MSVHPHFKLMCSDKPGNLSRILADIKDPKNIRNEDGKTPLFFSQNCKCLKLLLDAGFEVNSVDNNGETAIFYMKSVNSLKYLYDKKADINVVNNNGESLLHKTDDFEIIDFLVEKGIDVNLRDNLGRTALFNRNERVTQKLMKIISNEIKDNEGKTAIYYASNVNILSLLLPSFDVKSRDKRGKPYPFTFINDEKMMEHICSKSIINEETDDRFLRLNDCLDADLNNLLHACTNINIFQMLIKVLDIRKWNRYMKTPFHITEDEKIVKLLLEDDRCNFINLKDINGDTKLHLTRNIEIVKLIIAKGGKVDRKNDLDKFPCDVQKDDEIRKLLLENTNIIKLNVKKSHNVLKRMFRKMFSKK